MKEKRYNKIKNTIIASASSGLLAGMFLVGGINSVYAESFNKTIPVYTNKKTAELKTATKSKQDFSKKHARGWRKNTI